MSRTVQNAVDEMQAEMVSDLSDASMIVYFRSGLRFMPALIRSRLFLAEDSMSLAAGEDSDDLTDLSPAFTRERHVWYVDDGGARIPILRPPSIEYFHELRGSQSVGKPEYYRVAGQTIYFDKALDATTTWGLDYFFDQTDGIALATVMAMDETVFEAAKCFGKSEYYRQYEEDRAKADDYERKGKEILAVLDADYQEQEFANGTIEETEVY